MSISAPANNATVNGIVNVVADASDNVGVDRVQFQIDGVDAGPHGLRCALRAGVGYADGGERAACGAGAGV